MTEKRLFQVLDEMNQHDTENKTALIGLCNQLISGDKVKGGAKISMGAPEGALHDIMSGKTIPILLLINKEEYFKRKEK